MYSPVGVRPSRKISTRSNTFLCIIALIEIILVIFLVVAFIWVFVHADSYKLDTKLTLGSSSNSLENEPTVNNYADCINSADNEQLSNFTSWTDFPEPMPNCAVDKAYYALPVREIYKFIGNWSNPLYLRVWWRIYIRFRKICRNNTDLHFKQINH